MDVADFPGKPRHRFGLHIRADNFGERGIQLMEEAACPTGEDKSLLRQETSCSPPIEEAHVQFVFKRSYGACNRRLGDVECVGGGIHRTCCRDKLECAQSI